MSLHPTLTDHFGRRYIMLNRHHSRLRAALRAETFTSPAQALQFLYQLRAPVDYWCHLTLNNTARIQSFHDEHRLCEELSRMLYRGTIKAYRLHTAAEATAPSIGFSDEDSTHYALKPVSYLLLNQPEELKHFDDEPQALAFLEQSGVEETQLKELTEEQNLPTGKDTFHTAAKALVAGSLIVVVSRYTRPPTPTESFSGPEPLADKAAGLGPPPDEFKEINMELMDEFDNSLGSAFTALFDGVEFTLKTDLGDEHQGTIQNGKIHIPKAKMNQSFELKFKDLPAFMEE